MRSTREKFSSCRIGKGGGENVQRVELIIPFYLSREVYEYLTLMQGTSDSRWKRRRLPDRQKEGMRPGKKR